MRFQAVGEHQRETMLMHFAEPLQFIHNLDIAHVFEHYYRYSIISKWTKVCHEINVSSGFLGGGGGGGGAFPPLKMANFHLIIKPVAKYF